MQQHMKMQRPGHMLHRLGLGMGLGLFLIALTTCSIDQGIEPQIGVPAIRGTITFKGNPPANTHWVVVVASRDFPPSDVVQLALSQSARLDFNAGSADYEIKVPSLGSYAAIAVVWKARDEPVIWSDVLGLYGASFTGGISFPDTVHVTGDAPIVDNIDVTADFTAVDRGAVLGGRITYEGNWPDNTELMGIAAYRARPANLLEFFQPAALNISLPTQVDFFDYRLATPPGTYGYTVVLWLGRGSSIFDFKQIGFYETSPGSGEPAEVSVALGDTVRNVDITVDLRQAR
jgi:hypothetical protein